MMVEPGFAGGTVAVVALAWLRRPPAVVRRPTPSASCSSPAAHARAVGARRPAPRWIEHVLAELGLGVDPATAWTATRWFAGAPIVLALLVAGPVGGALSAALMAAIPAGVRRLLAWRWADRRDAQLPLALERVASAVRAGSALGQAIISTAPAVPDPLGAELHSLAAEIEHGAGLGAALRRWGTSVGSGAHERLAAAALELAADAGGEVARSVDRVAATLRDRREVQAEVRSLATQARASAIVLAVAPVGFTMLVAGLEPTMLSFLLGSLPGLVCLVTGLGLEIAGAAWMARILRSVR